MDLIVPVGGRTQWEVGGPAPAAEHETRAPGALVRYEPADMTISVGAGMTFDALDAIVAPHGQEVPLDPRSRAATIGGLLACGLSGPRRLRHGPLRDHVLEVRIALADGRVVKGGGPTVKNVTGYDLPRLFVGSLGTLGLILEATLRCRPRPAVSRWCAAPAAASFHRPAARLWDGTHEWVLLEGNRADVDAQSAPLPALDAPPALPEGPHRGRVSVAPARVRAVGAALDGDVRWCAEVGVGTVHVAADDVKGLERAREIARAHDGWLLREAGGAAADDGYGRPLPNLALMRRIKDAFDPEHRCNPGRMPL